jgi:DNA-binding transcriptional LysR family regulator
VALRTFEAAVRRLSCTRAAPELSVTHGAMSHQVRGLFAAHRHPQTCLADWLRLTGVTGVEPTAGQRFETFYFLLQAAVSGFGWQSVPIRSWPMTLQRDDSWRPLALCQMVCSCISPIPKPVPRIHRLWRSGTGCLRQGERRRVQTAWDESRASAVGVEAYGVLGRCAWLPVEFRLNQLRPIEALAQLLPGDVNRFPGCNGFC